MLCEYCLKMVAPCYVEVEGLSPTQYSHEGLWAKERMLTYCMMYIRRFPRNYHELCVVVLQ